ncbi:DUF6879 family protein [Saccharopolyspora flava]|nr:DUF6879 family protein [Saccharopolyspora flava]
MSDLPGERLELDAYLDDFDARFADARGAVWKLERRQHFRQPESESWTAFSEGNWDRALQLLERSGPGVAAEYRTIADSGLSVHRVRVVEEPIVPYLQWELHSLRIREQCGEHINVVSADQVASFEQDEQLPEIVTLGDAVLYQLIYTDDGILDGAVRVTERAVVEEQQRFVRALFARGEPLERVFSRRVVDLPPPHGQ